MGNKRRFTFLELLNIVYFLAVLFVLVCKFGLLFERRISERIFHIFYYYCSTITLGFSIIAILILVWKIKRLRNNEESDSCVKDLLASINLSVISFQFLASLFGTLSGKRIAFEWFQLTIYVSIIAIILNTIIYFFTRGRIAKTNGYYNQKEILNMYVIYVVVVSFLLGIIIPYLMIHMGVFKLIRGN